MGLRFKIFFTLVIIFSASAAFGMDAPETEQTSDSLEMIAQRMRSLTSSLEGMPQPPAFNQKIQLPGDFLPVPQSSTSSEEDDFLEKENEV